MSEANKYYIYINNQKIEVAEEIYIEYWKSIEHERYQIKMAKKLHIYIDSLKDEFDNNSIEKSLVNNNPTHEYAMKNIEKSLLLKAINSLRIEEQKLIYALYFQQLSQVEYSIIINKSRQYVSKIHANAIEKLKILYYFK